MHPHSPLPPARHPPTHLQSVELRGGGGAVHACAQGLQHLQTRNDWSNEVGTLQESGGTQGHVRREAACRRAGSRGSRVQRRVAGGIPAPLHTLQLHMYQSSSAAVAEWLGLPSAHLAAASAGEFLTGE